MSGKDHNIVFCDIVVLNLQCRTFVHKNTVNVFMTALT